MGDTKIQGATKTWNPIRGCSRISAGCTSCYAEAFAARFSGLNPETGAPLAYHGLAKMTANGPRWTGKLMVVSNAMDDPHRWRKPQRVFVNSMSDLFHERLPADAIARVFRVMLNAPWHIFMVLTKRAQRMCEWVAAFEQERGEALPTHIHMGVSVEDQKNAEARMPWLLRTRAQVRFVSAEPLLGPVDFSPWLDDNPIDEAEREERGDPLSGGAGSLPGDIQAPFEVGGGTAVGGIGFALQAEVGGEGWRGGDRSEGGRGAGHGCGTGGVGCQAARAARAAALRVTWATPALRSASARSAGDRRTMMGEDSVRRWFSLGIAITYSKIRSRPKTRPRGHVRPGRSV